MWMTGVIGLMSVIAAFATANAQAPDPTAAHTTHAQAAPSASADSARLQQEVSKLRAQLSQLEQRMQASASGTMQRGKGTHGQSKGAMAPMQPKMKGGMAMMDDDMEMPMGQMKSGSSMSMPSGGGMGMGMGDDMMSMMHGDDDMMGMGAMGGMNSPAAMATPSALPGFPGQSHLYHIGATDFFLDHPQHISLSTQQQQALAQQKQQSLARQGELQRQIDAAEQELWQLTAADQPQIGSIEKKAREIERLRADKRIAFIRSVGDATKVLTDEQRQQLTGMAPAQPAADQAPMPMPDASQQKPAMDHM
jgi:hypothetical protein